MRSFLNFILFNDDPVLFSSQCSPGTSCAPDPPYLLTLYYEHVSSPICPSVLSAFHLRYVFLPR